MKLHSTLVLLFLFSSYRLAESNTLNFDLKGLLEGHGISKIVTEADISYKAAIKELATGNRKVYNAIKSILNEIEDSQTEGNKAVESALKVLTEVLLTSKDNGKTGNSTAAYIQMLATGVNLAALAAKATTNATVDISVDYVKNSGIVAIETLKDEVLAITDSEEALNVQSVGSIQQAILTLKTIGTGFKTSAKVALQVLVDDPIVGDEIGLESDEAAAVLGNALEELSEELENAAALSLKAVQTIENS